MLGTGQVDGEKIRVILFGASEVEDTGRPGGREHVLQRGELHLEIFLRGQFARGLAVGFNGPGPLVLEDLARSAAARLGRGSASFPFTGSPDARFGLVNLLLQLVNGLLDVRDIVGQLPFRTVISEEFHLGKAHLRVARQL